MRKTASAARPLAGPGPAQLRVDLQPQRPGNGVDARLVRELAERQHEHEHERNPDADRGSQTRSREAGREPGDENDEPQRDQVEAVAIVEPVVAPRCACEGGDHEEPRDVGRCEQRHEGRRATRARSPVPYEFPEDDRRDGDRDDRQVDGEVA